MKNSSRVLKWAQNNKNNKLSNGKGKEEKKWLHAPETLLAGHVVYLVKFLGSTEVDQPKGIEVVKQGIQKLKFSQQIKKSEGGNTKTPKAELTISVDGVAIQEPKTKKMLHQYPLHKISYCADDKAEKRFFSFIAKEGDTNQHTCFVFVSDKLAEEITLTIGQAFELAYKKFLDTSGKDMETKEQLLVLQKRVAILENENGELKKRLRDVANIKGLNDVQEYMHKNDITDICHVPPVVANNNNSGASATSTSNQNSTPTSPPPAAAAETSPSSELICLEADLSGSGANLTAKLDGFSLDDINDDDFNPRGESENSSDLDEADFDPRAPTVTSPPAAPAPTLLSPPPPALPPRVSENNSHNMNVDIFAKNPFSGGADPFGMSAFDSPNSKMDNAFAATTFSLDELDPLKK